MTPVQYFTIDEVATRYHVPISTMRRWRTIGYGPRGVRVGRRLLYSSTEIDRFDAALDKKIQEQR